MERTIRVCCAILFLLSLLFVRIQADIKNEEKDLAVAGSGKATTYWMDPRVGRRKRNPKPDEGGYRTPVLESEQLVEIMDAIQDSPWAIVAVKEGKRDFTPRLGRDSGEESLNSPSQSYGGSDRWLQDSDLVGEYMQQRSPPFAPRLGRQAWYSSYNQTPRLGRRAQKSGQ